MKKIVLTGGPCAGKTSALSILTEKMMDCGYVVMVVPEMATTIINSGLSPVNIAHLEDPLPYYTFQESIINLQIAHEEAYDKMLFVKPPGEAANRLLICDRGCMDSKAYLSDKQWTSILTKNRWTTSQLRDRYDAIFHLVSVADGKEECYNQTNNTARYEDATAAKNSDARTKAAWLGHRHLSIIGNENTFEQKAHKLVQAVQKSLGIPTSLEIERKYIIVGNFDPENDIPWPRWGDKIEQTYLKNTDGVEERVRARGGEQFYHTIKREVRDGVREEYERSISAYEYDEFMRRRDPLYETIEKIRYCFIHNNQYFELDHYIKPDKIAGLKVLEIELTEENNKVSLPGWLGECKDVTGNKSYSNKALARS
jgi:CYTH domain-containing protein